MCIQQGWTCPGYDRDWKFIDLNSQLNKYYEGRKYLLEVNPRDSDASNLEDSAANGFEFHLHTLSIPLIPPASPSESLRSAVAHILVDARCSPIISPQVASGMLPLAVSHLGHNMALDAAALCLCQAYNDVLRGRDASLATTQHYISTIAILRHHILNPLLRAQSETICASILIQTCQVILPCSFAMLLSS